MIRGLALRQTAARDLGIAAALAAAAVGVALAFLASAYAIHPAALPAAAVAGGIALATVARPEVGVFAAFLLVPVANLGIAGSAPWILPAAWSAVLFALALPRIDRPQLAVRGAGLLTWTVIAALIVAALTFVLADGQPDFAVLRSQVTGLLLYIAVAVLVRTRDHIRWVLAGIAVCVTLVGVQALYERTVGVSSSEAFLTAGGSAVGRIAAGFGHPNQLGGFIVVCLPFVIAAWLLLRNRWLGAIGIVAGAFAVYVSLSRGSMIALAIAPLVFFRGRRLLLLLPALAVLVVAAAPDLLRERFATLASGGAEITTRTEFWRTSASIWTEHPLAGFGPGTFPQAYTQSRVPERNFLPGTLSEPPPHAHNIELHVLAEQGLLGLLALVAVLAVAVFLAIGLRRSSDRMTSVIGSAALGSLIAFGIHNQFDVTLLESTGTYFWALLGILAAMTVQSSREVRV